MRILLLSSLIVLSVVLSTHPPTEAAELELLDKPLWVFPGQTFRIAIRQPEGAKGRAKGARSAA